MGVLYTKKLEGPAEIGIWHISEEEGDLLKQVMLSDTEKELYSSFRTDWRRRQWLAYRRLIRELISPQRFPVHYDDAGKPFLAGSEWHISVTHTDDYAGVIISKNVSVGIDMERVRPRIGKVKEKFLSEEELSAIPDVNSLEHLTLAWCAKETLYKLYGYRNLDFRSQIHVALPVTVGTGSFPGSITLPSGKTDFKLYHEKRGDLLIVWAVGMVEQSGSIPPSKI